MCFKLLTLEVGTACLTIEVFSLCPELWPGQGLCPLSTHRPVFQLSRGHAALRRLGPPVVTTSFPATHLHWHTTCSTEHPAPSPFPTRMKL